MKRFVAGADRTESTLLPECFNAGIASRLALRCWAPYSGFSLQARPTRCAGGHDPNGGGQMAYPAADATMFERENSPRLPSQGFFARLTAARSDSIRPAIDLI